MTDLTIDVRELFYALLDDKERVPMTHLLLPWLSAHMEQGEWIRAFAARAGTPLPAASGDELEHLYALSRVNQMLLLRFQSECTDGGLWPGPDITNADYTGFWEQLGLTVQTPLRFAPFYHEIVEVEQAEEPDASITLVGTFWPCLMLGPLLFERAGAWVTGGARHVRKEIAENSTLYWTYQRRNRPYRDLSQGWGHNSQWRTDFRRDYRIGGRSWYNVDGEPSGGDGPVVGFDLTRASTNRGLDGLTRAERIELLTHRCFVVSDKPHGDLWPYDDRWSEAQ